MERTSRNASYRDRLPGKLRPLLRYLITDNPMVDQPSMRRQAASQTLHVVSVLIAIGATLMVLAGGVTQNGIMPTVTIPIGELLIVTLVTPFLVYDAITRERERGTWVSLLMTPLTPEQIVVGKLIMPLSVGLATVAVGSLLTIVDIALLIPASVPINFGALAMEQLALLGWSLFLNAGGLFLSAVSRRRVAAGALCFLSLVTMLVFVPILQCLPIHGVKALIVLNPFLSIAALAPLLGEAGASLPNSTTLSLAMACLTYVGLAAGLLFITRRKLTEV